MTKKQNSTNNLITQAISGIEEMKGKDIVLLNLKAIDSAVCDYFIVCTGTSSTHVNAIVNSIRKTVSKATGEKPWHIEGENNGEWVLLDYVNVVIHVFQKHAREYYDIESLWGDAEAIAVGEN